MQVEMSCRSDSRTHEQKMNYGEDNIGDRWAYKVVLLWTKYYFVICKSLYTSTASCSAGLTIVCTVAPVFQVTTGSTSIINLVGVLVYVRPAQNPCCSVATWHETTSRETSPSCSIFNSNTYCGIRIRNSPHWTNVLVHIFHENSCISVPCFKAF